MDPEYNVEFEDNDKEYKEGLESNPNLFNEINDEPPTIYNPASFQANIIINYLQKQKILRSNIVCPKCGNVMNMISNNASIDKLVWRCHKRQPSHDIKINIREGSIFEGFQIKIPILYFLMYFCFIENISINSAIIKCNDFSYQVGEGGITAQSIIKFYSVVREKLRGKMHGKKI